MRILVLNSGSSTQKSALFDLTGALSLDPQPPLWESKIEWNPGSANLQVRTAHGGKFEKQISVQDRHAAVEAALETMWSGDTRVLAAPSDIQVVGHRVVHGGRKLDDPTRITPAVKDIIASVSVFAPLHNPPALEGIEIIERIMSAVPQVAVFDTGFHKTLPAVAALYPGPYEWQNEGIRRYGFHGINHAYCAKRAARILGKELDALKIVTCHLGNGCSLTAIAKGESVDTTMGFTPLEGIMMGTRSGSVDPGILTYFLRKDGTRGQDLDHMLNHRSGLLGVSGLSSDMREIEAAAANGNQRAQLAFDMFVNRLQKGIASMAASLGGLDVLAFTAGIGENSARVRSKTCSKLDFLGVELDAEKNEKPCLDQEISSRASRVRAMVIRAQEDWAIAQDCVRVMQSAATSY